MHMMNLPVVVIRTCMHAVHTPVTGRVSLHHVESMMLCARVLQSRV
jgi:hypothetical protein